MLNRMLLFSTDEDLAGSCREVLAEVFGPDFALTLGDAGKGFQFNDFCIWDCTSEPRVAPDRLVDIDPGKHLFILFASDLLRLQGRVSPSALRLVCKPVTKAIFRSFFRRALREWQKIEATSSAVEVVQRTKRRLVTVQELQASPSNAER